MGHGFQFYTLGFAVVIDEFNEWVELIQGIYAIGLATNFCTARATYGGTKDLP